MIFAQIVHSDKRNQKCEVILIYYIPGVIIDYILLFITQRVRNRTKKILICKLAVILKEKKLFNKNTFKMIGISGTYTGNWPQLILNRMNDSIYFFLGLFARFNGLFVQGTTYLNFFFQSLPASSHSIHDWYILTSMFVTPFRDWTLVNLKENFNTTNRL